MSKEEVNEVFLVYSDEPGEMNVDRIGSALRALGFNPSDVQVQAYINEADYDGSGTIDLDTFRSIVAKQAAHPKDTMEQLQHAFTIFDKDGNGSILTEELQYLVTKLGAISSLIWFQLIIKPFIAFTSFSDLPARTQILVTHISEGLQSFILSLVSLKAAIVLISSFVEMILIPCFWVN
eukprot:m.40386 g.40386  ORF g.40386 m.40386 type:complete len:179 (+) comp11709_c0_seq3:155-691(+)